MSGTQSNVKYAAAQTRTKTHHASRFHHLFEQQGFLSVETLVCTDDAASRKKPPVAQAKAPDSTQLEGQAVSKRARSPRLCWRVRCCLAAWKLTRDSKHDGCLGAQTQIQRLHTSPSDSTVIASGTPQVTTCQVQWRGPTNPQTQIGETKSQ